MKKILLLFCCTPLFTQCILPENEDDGLFTDDIVAVDDGISGTDDGTSGTDDGTGSDDPYYGLINFPLTGVAPITEGPQCGQLQVAGRDTVGPPYIAVRALGITQGGTSFNSDYYLVYAGNVNYKDHPYMYVDYRPTHDEALFYVSTSGSGYWSSPNSYVMVADVRELRRNGAPNYDYYLYGPTFTVSAELQYDYEDVVNLCF